MPQAEPPDGTSPSMQTDGQDGTIDVGDQANGGVDGNTMKFSIDAFDAVNEHANGK